VPGRAVGPPRTLLSGPPREELTAEAFLHALARVADLLDGLLHRRRRSPGLLRLIARFVLLTAGHSGPILFASACRLLRCHRVAFQRRKPAAIGVKAPFPGFIEPALATAVEKVPSGARWIHEIKFDGYRVQVHLANEEVKVFTRRGHDWTNRFKKVAEDAWHIKAGSAIVDGEIVVPAADGTTDFSVLQNELKGKSTSIVLVAFDLLYLNGRDLRKLSLVARKAELKKIIAGTNVQFSESFEIEGRSMFEHACKLGLEGVVSKVRDSAYASGRGNNWVKKTCAQRETLAIAGFALDEGKWDGIYLGRHKGADLVYAGKVDHGFDKVSAAELQKRLKPLIRKTQPYAKRIAHKGIWVEPKLLAEIEYRAKSAEGKVRHPFFKGLREDL
jgi:bifunctional non-homologous end joining protein LigD